MTGGFVLVGGLLGYNAGQVVHCDVEGALSGAGGMSGVAMGGLIGRNQGRVERCYTDMTLRHEGQAMLGGLVGHNGVSNYFQTPGEICDAYSLGTLQCLEPRALGGLVGRNDGRVARCYAATSVGRVSLPNPSVGALIGSGDEDVSFCYYLPVEGRPELDNGIGTALTDDQMRRPESFGGWEFYGTSPTGKNNPWFMPASGYPVLTWQSDRTGVHLIPEVTGLTEDKAASRLAEMSFTHVTIYHEFDHRQPTGLALCTDPVLYASAGTEIGLYVSAGLYDWSDNPGRGSIDDPYQIQNAGQLDSLHARPDLWKANFQLQNDIDLKSRVYDKALLGFDEDLVEDGFQGVFFQGHLDGQGHAIRNLTVQSPALGMYLGLVGYAGQEALIERLCLEDTVITVGQGGIYVGMVAGYMPDSVSESYFLSDGIDVDLDNGIGTALSDAQMRVQNSFQGWDFENETAHGTIGIWRMPEAGGYPNLSFDMTDPWIPGVPSSPALITSAEDLRQLYYHPLASFQLAEDIDLAGIQWATAPLPLFAGSLDGDGHALRNLSVVCNRNAGFFGCLNRRAQVFDLAFEAAELGLAEVSHVVGTVAAVNEGRISRCVARGRVQGDWYVGGLVGINRGDIVDCYGTVALEAQSWSGGLVGHNDTGGLMRRCYSNGSVSETGSQWSVGPVVGYNYGSAFHCFWDKEVAMNLSSQLGRGKTTDQMLRSET